MSNVIQLQFQVPQFTETETKLIGPLTLKQFLWLAGGGTIIYILGFLVTGTTFIIFAILLGALSVTFAFAKVQGMSLIKYVGFALGYFLKIEHFSYDTSKEEKYLPEEKHHVEY